jgi:hypothetical protein
MKKALNNLTHAAVIADYNNNLVVPFAGNIFKADIITLVACFEGFPQDIRGLPVKLLPEQSTELVGLIRETLKESRELYFERLAVANANASNLIKEAVAELIGQEEHVE